MSELKILSYFQRDRNSVLSKVYNEHYEKLFKQGVRLGYSPEQTKDLIQQLFLSFAEKHTRFDNLKNVEAFVVTCFKRKLIDYHRSEQTIKNKISSFYEETQLLDNAGILENNEDRLELSLKIKNVYDSLPPRYQDVIYYKYGMGLSNEEIAKKTGLSLRSIYNNIYNAVKIMRQKIYENPTRR